ncbi:hypothetical protein ACK8P5_25755 (plasmid) [Paenibacillus sp. EC2-1]|uniref:hypothetical protein n=1 Tax=Paenibacillus sp. EC2-1 TaxID=3388665 RepID=UPI003BEEC26F
MADERIIKLARGYNGFFCPQTRFHLIGNIKPQAQYPADLPLSDSIKRGLRGGTLIDVNKVFSKEDLSLKGVPVAVEIKRNTPSVSLDPVTLKQAGEDVQAGEYAQSDKDATSSVGLDQESQNTSQSVSGTEGDVLYGELSALSKEEIDNGKRSDLIDFIKGNEIDMAELDLNSRSGIDEIKVALRKKFGYI